MKETRQNAPKKYECVVCDYRCCKKSDYTRHLSTDKHKRQQRQHLGNAKRAYSCTCGKTYQNRSGLWRHKGKCLFSVNKCETTNLTTITQKNTCGELDTLDTELFKEVILQNRELQRIVQEQQKQIDNQNVKHHEEMMRVIPSIGNNNNNTNFNINMFLNEECKDAVPLIDFVNNLQLSLSDLSDTGKNGFIEGISNIFIRGLAELDISKRPIHCSDLKREIMYVKNEANWQKDVDKKILNDAIDQARYLNLKQLRNWTDIHPNYTENNHPHNDDYMQIVENTVLDDAAQEKQSKKIIKNIAESVIINGNK